MAYKELITIICDTREQKPLSFGRYKDVESVREGLKQGDYGAVLHTKFGDLKSRLVFDRKSKGDLWGTFAGNYDRFKREFNRSLVAHEKLCLITEDGVSDICTKGFFFKGRRHKTSGATLQKKLETLREKYGLEVVYCAGRTDMQRYLVGRFMAQCRLVNALLKEFNKTDNWELLNTINRKVFLWDTRAEAISKQ